MTITYGNILWSLVSCLFPGLLRTIYLRPAFTDSKIVLALTPPDRSPMQLVASTSPAARFWWLCLHSTSTSERGGDLERMMDGISSSGYYDYSDLDLDLGFEFFRDAPPPARTRARAWNMEALI